MHTVRDGTGAAFQDSVQRCGLCNAAGDLLPRRRQHHRDACGALHHWRPLRPARRLERPLLRLLWWARTPPARTRTLQDQHSSCCHPAHLLGHHFKSEATPLYASVGVGALQVAPCSARCAVNILHNLNMFTGWQEQKESKVLLCSAGDTHPTRTLNELAEGTDMLIQQIMGPLPAFDTLSFESQYLLNVSQRILLP